MHCTIDIDSSKLKTCSSLIFFFNHAIKIHIIEPQKRNFSSEQTQTRDMFLTPTDVDKLYSKPSTQKILEQSTKQQNQVHQNKRFHME